MSFDAKQLRGFLAVVDSGSIGSAAGLMNMSQPTLSRLMKGLEERHCVRLFERTATGIVLTEAGTALLPHARHLLFELGQAADSLRALRGLSRGVVRLGASPAVMLPIVAPAVARLRKDNPELQIEIMEGLDNRLVEALRTYTIDLMIGSNVDDTSDLRQVGGVLLEDTFHVCCAVDHPFARRQTLRAADVLPGNWAMPPRGYTPRVAFEDIVRTHGLPMPNVVIEAVSPMILIDSVIASGVFAWLAGLASSQPYASRVVLLDLPEFEVKRQFRAYRRGQGILSTAAEHFVKMLLPAET